MKIKVSDNKHHVALIRQKLKENDGYCPCMLTRSEDTKCMCKSFREQQEEGECHCGLYIKVEGE